MNQMNIPASEPNDSDDVTLALQTAEALWNKGDPGEALRWLRRAAEAAGDSGDDMRAVVLAKAVAELNSANHESAAPKQVKPPPLPPQAAAKTESNGESHDAEPMFAAKGGLKGVSKPPPSPPSARKSLPPKPPSPPSGRPSKAAEAAAEAVADEDVADATAETKPAEAKPAKTLKPPPTPPAAKQNVGEVAESKTAAEPTTTEPASKASSGLNRSVRPSSSRLPAANASRAPTSSKAPSRNSRPKNFARAAVRVYVSNKEQEGDKLEVFVLEAGQRPPAGTIEAMLVPLRRGAKIIVK